MGSVVQRAHVTVTQPLHGSFIVHSDQEPIHFSNLEQALARAADIAREKVCRLAVAAGAESMDVRLSSEDNHVHHDVDGDLFLKTRITATASGRPDLSKMDRIVLLSSSFKIF
jgi:hypothetical protein